MPEARPGPVFQAPSPPPELAMSEDFVQLRHRPPAALDRLRPLLVACPPMRSNVNLSADRAGGLLLRRAKNHLLRKRQDRPDHHPPYRGCDKDRSPPHPAPVLKRLHAEGYPLVGLEQTSGSQCLYDFRFPCRMVLVIGNERLGIDASRFGCSTRPWKSPSTACPTATMWPRPRPWPSMNTAGNTQKGSARRRLCFSITSVAATGYVMLKHNLRGSPTC